MMTKLAFSAAFAAALLTGPFSAVADQNDPRLPELFTQLQQTAAPPAYSARIEQDIWQIWSRSDNGEVNSYMLGGMHAMAIGNMAKALDLFTAATRTDDAFAEGWNKRATVLFMMGKLPESLQDVQRTLALEPRHFGALAGLGLIYEALGEAEGAQAAFERALAINPHLAHVRQRLEILREDNRENPI